MVAHLKIETSENRVMDSVRSIQGVLVTAVTIGLGLLQNFFSK